MHGHSGASEYHLYKSPSLLSSKAHTIAPVKVLTITIAAIHGKDSAKLILLRSLVKKSQTVNYLLTGKISAIVGPNPT